ncbi:carbamoyl-phosphate synthase large subunit [Leptospira langatensis]|uniref:acetyl-CoA carboxylase n=1 Tax=Leptospira langatensis TaxID=2484983 RepID=A0A5F1ZWN5_9LEPT|nr:carboxyl transferase domain-containing protein [Leptospira langatensis]TGJ98160.1 carbamoyl-phosphate synthase large subunit [Leptospira langatensis]TGL43074.1 carbamoyl-phosphate synthase large subunit [Leptospira langatensis]
MKVSKLLIANRGEVSLRISRAAAELEIQSVSIYSEDDQNSRHRLAADQALPLRGKGVPSYMDQEQILKLAKENHCDGIHPGYGFLSENHEFAEKCEKSNIGFIGPNSSTLRMLGDKLEAIRLVEELGLPVLPGIRKVASLEDAKEFLSEQGSIMIKALAGGGGRGIRVATKREELEELFKTCSEEARAAFGNSNVYLEKFLPKARHIEVQILGDGTGDIVHLWERDCSLQRRNQKLVEIAPAPFLPSQIREKIYSYSKTIAKHLQYKNLGTFEFLLDLEDPKNVYFMEANPRLQVEHTVTEEVTGLDLVQLQLQIANGKSLKDLSLTQESIPSPKGYAVQIRINSEIMDEKGNTRPSSGNIRLFEPSSGPGIRVDSAAYSGYDLNPNYDSLLAKLIVRSRSENFTNLLSSSLRALEEFRIVGVPTNIGFLQNLLRSKEVREYSIHTQFIQERISELVQAKPSDSKQFPFEVGSLTLSKSKSDADEIFADGIVRFASPMAGRLMEILPSEGDYIRKGQKLALLSSMKMEHVLSSEISGYVESILVSAEDTVSESQTLLLIRKSDQEEEHHTEDVSVDPDRIRVDLQEVKDRLSINEDAARSQAVSKRHKRGQRTARENIADLCDPGSFVEYGALALAAQRRRRTLEELIKLSPADGLVAGLGTTNGDLFEPHRSRISVLAYDYTVFMGTQGAMNHKKTDRFLQMIKEQRLPLVFFTEGGGGRPGEVDVPAVAGLDLHTFRQYASLKGILPRIAVNAGRCFAGNAALFGASDIRIATEDSNIGMGGPVMVKGGGLGSFSAEEIGPTSVQTRNGVIDILVKNELEGVRIAKQALSYFQGNLQKFESSDQRALRNSIPENRLRSYDIRKLIEVLADKHSVLELQREYAKGIVTSFIRVEGRALGLVANDPTHLGGAIDAEGAEKSARFLDFCNTFKIPVLFLCDTPGFMVGPDVEKKGLVRKAAELFGAGASLRVPVFTIILRKGYGLGAMAMAAGSFHAPVFTISWPTGEFGAMGIEGEIRTGFQKELAEVKDWKERQLLFERLVAEAYERGKAINMASYLEIDAVIDPVDSRKWIVRGLDSCD